MYDTEHTAIVALLLHTQRLSLKRTCDICLKLRELQSSVAFMQLHTLSPPSLPPWSSMCQEYTSLRYTQDNRHILYLVMKYTKSRCLHLYTHLSHNTCLMQTRSSDVIIYLTILQVCLAFHSQQSCCVPPPQLPCPSPPPPTS